MQIARCNSETVVRLHMTYILSDNCHVKYSIHLLANTSIQILHTCVYHSGATLIWTPLGLKSVLISEASYFRSCNLHKQGGDVVYMYVHIYTMSPHLLLFCLCVCSLTSCVTHLLRNFAGSSPFTTDINGLTPLHYAACYGHKMAVQMVNPFNYHVPD